MLVGTETYGDMLTLYNKIVKPVNADRTGLPVQSQAAVQKMTKSPESWPSRTFAVCVLWCTFVAATIVYLVAESQNAAV